MTTSNSIKFVEKASMYLYVLPYMVDECRTRHRGRVSPTCLCAFPSVPCFRFKAFYSKFIRQISSSWDFEFRRWLCRVPCSQFLSFAVKMANTNTPRSTLAEKRE